MQRLGVGLGFITLLSAALLLPLTGCSNSGSSDSGSSSSNTSSTAVNTAGDATLIAAGQSVFTSNGCGNCHAVSGQGGGRAPDLTRVGAEAEHTSEWIVAHVKNPKTHNPGSRMPSFEGKINDKDLLALGAYLSSLK
ncbi:MAG TPA: cytochrome c [Abditibacteriaceae bacterium]|jgi:mono/diheme cytochrome c family protein